MSKQFIGVIAAIILIFVGIVVFTGHKSDSSGGKKSSSSALTQHIEGGGSTGVTLVEYGDYQCPYCQVYYATVKQVVTKYNDQIKFQFRNFPLINLHPNAFAAARAAEAAGKQNKYWEMHDILYENNDPNGKQGWVASPNATTYFDQFAQQLGLNMTKYKADYASSATNDAVNADIAEGNKLGITGTPTFFLDGKKIDVTNQESAFDKFIQAEISKKAPNASTSSTTSTPTTTTSGDSTTSGQ